MIHRSKKLLAMCSGAAVTLLAIGLTSAYGNVLDVPSSAYQEGAIHDGDARLQSSLVLDAEAVAPGDTVRVGVVFELDEDWHIYWQNPGEAGIPTDIEWQSDDLEFGPLKWAAPSTFGDPGGELTSYGYTDQVVLFSDATVAPDAAGSIELSASVDYLACHDLCMPGHSTLSRTIPVAPATVPAAANVLSVLDDSEARVPQRAADVGLQTRFHYSQAPLRPGDSFETAVEIIECAAPGEDCRDFTVVYDEREHAFMPDAFSAPNVEVTAVSAHPEAASGLVLLLKGELPDSFEYTTKLLSGVVQLEQADGTVIPVHLRDELDVAETGAQVEAVALPAWTDIAAKNGFSTGAKGGLGGGGAIGMFWMLLMAFLGGMILNLMPCVFPVLALKVSAFTRLAHESKNSIYAHGAAYTGGIVGSMLVLAGAVIGLRLAGTQVGWGFQFQQPYFLAALVVILVLFALNLFGVFEVTLSSQQVHEKAANSTGVRRSFWEGVLAVVLATPCSAPFLGTAVGFALAGSGWAIVGVFTALGLGLAAPMVVLTLMPGWARVLPRPGDWMAHLKKFLGFALTGSAIWIIWLLGRQTGVDGMARMLVFAAVLALAAWLWGMVQFQAMSKKKLTGIAVALALIGTAAAWTFPLSPADRQSNASMRGSSVIEWEPWTEAAVREALDEGRPVFVDFTADWCLTCKVNEKNAIDTAPVHAAMDTYDVLMLKADWTNPDERIRTKLAEFGRAGVPFYLVYSPASRQATALPDVITADMLVNAFEEASGDSGS